MTFSILWLVLAATVTVVVSMRRSDTTRDEGEVKIWRSGKLLTGVAVVYSLVLLAGFLYTGWQHGLELIK
jgi:heme/copper-type cytochrome/quinol oxidase subunit 2